MIGLSRCGKKQSGLASVELAIVTPFLLVMLLVASEFSRAFYEYNTLTKSVRDAARFVAEGAVNASTGNFELNNVAAAKNIAVYGNVAGTGTPVLKDFTPGQVTIAQQDTGGGATVQEHVQVTASYPFQPLSPTLSGMGFLTKDFDLQFTLVARSTMRGL